MNPVRFAHHAALVLDGLVECCHGHTRPCRHTEARRTNLRYIRERLVKVVQEVQEEKHPAPARPDAGPDPKPGGLGEKLA